MTLTPRSSRTARSRWPSRRWGRRCSRSTATSRTPERRTAPPRVRGVREPATWPRGRGTSDAPAGEAAESNVIDTEVDRRAW